MRGGIARRDGLVESVDAMNYVQIEMEVYRQAGKAYEM